MINFIDSILLKPSNINQAIPRLPPRQVHSMSSIKCKTCGLTNFAHAEVCVRCQNPLSSAPKAKKQKAPRSFSYLTLAALAAVVVVFYYMIGGFQQSMSQVNANEANRAATQAKDPDAGLSRSEADKKRTGQYGNAVLNSNSFSENQKHNEDIQKMLNTSQGQQQK